VSAVLADTGPLYALVDVDDRYHEEASQQLARLTALHFAVIVLQPIVLESYTLILRKLGRATARLWLHELSRGVDLLNPTADDYQEARNRVASYPDQEITLFDSLLATLAQRLEVPVWTYDFHFDVMRVESWRGP
jgi:predicted nucleic acid-binding protein